MFKKALVILALFSLVLSFACSTPNYKPGTRGRGSAREMDKDDHPTFPDDVACYVCHKDDIPDYAFHRDFGKKCDQCHVLTTWMAEKYPHAEWPLDEIHSVRCTRCHTEAARYDFAFYQCYGCHHEAAEIKASHASLNVNDLTKCAACHKGFPNEDAE